MLNCNATHVCCATRRWLWFGSLVVLLCFVLPTTAFAAALGPVDEESPTCTQCHSAEATAWGDSPHAHALETIEDCLQSSGSTAIEDDSECLSCHTTEYDAGAHTYAHAGVTCEACHGEYVQGHPQSGVMNLQVDSSSCQECHSTTSEEWQTTAHAEAGVQCISCHQPHSQVTRLDETALCASCHEERMETFDHTAHRVAGMTCTDCHLPGHSDGTAEAEVTLVGGAAAPDHSFKTAGGSCASCHGSNVHQQVVNEEAVQIGATQLVQMTERTRDLAEELDSVKRTNRSLQAMTVVSLGFGLGIGGVLGVIFLSLVCYLSREKAET